jgi:MFS family permease
MQERLCKGRPASGGWYTVGVCLALYVFAMIDRNIVNLVSVSLQHDLAIDDVKVGIVMGPAFGVPYVLAIYPFSWIGDKTSLRAVLFTCTILWSVATCACGFVHDYQGLFLARVLVGIGEAALVPAAIVLIAAKFPPRMLATALSVFSLATIVGPALAMGLGGWLVGLHQILSLSWLPVMTSWGYVFLFTGAPCFGLALLIPTLKEPATERQDRATNEPNELGFWQFVRSQGRIMAALFFGFGFVSLSSNALLGWMPSYLTRVHNWSTASAGLWIGSLLISAGAAGKLGSGLIVDYLYAKGVKDIHLRYPAVATLLALPCIIFIGWAASGEFALAMLGAYLILIYANLGYGSAFTQLAVPAHLRSRVSAAYIVCGSLFASAGPVAVGFLTEQIFGGKAAMGLSLAAVCTFSLVLAAVAFWQALPAVARMLRPSGA